MFFMYIIGLNEYFNKLTFTPTHTKGQKQMKLHMVYVQVVFRHMKKDQQVLYKPLSIYSCPNMT